MKPRNIVSSLVAAGVISVAALGGYATLGSHAYDGAMAANPPTVTVPTQTPSNTAAALPDFTGLVEANGPAVVNVSVTANAEKTAMPQMDPNDPFYQFFRQFGGQVQRPEAQPVHGLGSGFIVSPDGIILTNAHVVDGATNVTVKLTDKREFKAKVLGSDKLSDVAVLKIDARNLPVVKLDKADDVKVGQWVVAIGSPFGFDNTVTSGIVSAKSRSLPDGSYVPFIQTDVAVNPGNSGGPLFNLKGEVIGINSQIYTRSGGFQGLSFAIPIDVALNVQNQIVQHGTVTRGRLGIVIQDVNQGLADSFGLKTPAGALVSSVEPDGPAAKAGVQTGDVITRYNDKDITSSNELPVLVSAAAPGTTAKLQVIRNGQTKNIDVTVDAMKDAKVASAATPSADHGRLGLAVRPLNADEQKEAGVNGGLVVEDASGAAAKAGIQPGDVVLSLNGTPIKSAEQLRDLVSKAGKRIALLVQRENSRIFVPIDLG